METREIDVAVLGGGIGGYTAAIRASQLGLKVVLIERDKLGGTCLHRGCIPSKSLLRSAEVLDTVRRSEDFGIHAQGITLDLRRVMERKDQVVDQLYQGLQYLMRKHRIEVVQGHGRINGPSIFSPRSGAVALEHPNGEVETLLPKHLIIATGSRPRTLPGLEPDGRRVLTSDEAFDMTELPRSMIILGGGVIGVEWASLLQDFGVEVTIIEAEDRLVPAEDAEISQALARHLSGRGIKILTKCRVDPIQSEVMENGVRIAAVQDGQKLELTADKLLVAVGRQANVEDIGIDNTDVRLMDGGIRVNEFMQTTESHIYAVGDVNGQLLLAHAAAKQGVIAAEHLAGRSPEPFRPQLVPRCIYTRAEAASVGLTEQRAREQGYEVKVGKFPFSALGKALILGDRDGFVKVVADQQTNDILGVHLFGTHVTDLISEAALAQLLDATPWEVGQAVHPHPSLSEAIGEAMLAVDGLSLNL
ncbi:dihydrolipoyl dehydrogenase [Insulibacter thermoxylanivorax]|uniref:Dihydrolipoyl dehydrogenase n=1 Tax=Insulibacter thermoxylanivorax TaxID=2749268 RepID=A0A916Q9R0_9BACL|nr:dihydrolipoyl dehydrogenase [Insulibacter thermoxylanivorax]GFR36806.1 dihydrolipoyl dehydrogenase [Insulibacter thermoxylanivorax]